MEKKKNFSNACFFRVYSVSLVEEARIHHPVKRETCTVSHMANSTI